MEPLLAFAAEIWWLGPVVVGGGFAAVAGVRHQRRSRARTLEYVAAKHERDVAGTRVREALARVKSTQAALLVAKGSRQDRRAPMTEVDAARRRVADAQRELRSAQTALRGRRIQVQAARAVMRASPKDESQLPLPRLMAAHDAIITRWMRYETDASLALTFPSMVDASNPATAALLTAMDRARWLRPATAQTPMTPTAFAAYRGAVVELEAALDTAESDARRREGVREDPSGDGRSTLGDALPPLRESWDQLVKGARTTAAAAAAAMEAFSRANRRDKDDPPPR